MKMRASLLVALLLFVQELSFACPVCYGATDSPMANGVTTAIVVLLGITGSVLMAFAVFFLHLRKRARISMQDKFDFTSVN
jgi:hypothetical protein